MTPKQEKLIENYVRQKVKKMLKEEITPIFSIRKTFDNQHAREIAVYFDQQKANRICQILQQNAKDENYSEEINYHVVKGSSASPARK